MKPGDLVRIKLGHLEYEEPRFGIGLVVQFSDHESWVGVLWSRPNPNRRITFTSAHLLRPIDTRDT